MKIDYNNYVGPECRIPKEEKRRYLQTKKWTKIKCDLFVLRGEKCEDCGNRRNLHIHHLTYENFGDENPDDLIILCAGCHMLAHGLIAIRKKRKKKQNKKKQKKIKLSAKQFKKGRKIRQECQKALEGIHRNKKHSRLSLAGQKHEALQRINNYKDIL